jgi:hypothetical protein
VPQCARRYDLLPPTPPLALAETALGTTYLHSRSADDFAETEPLLGLRVSARDQLIIIDADADGDLDAIWFGETTSIATDSGTTSGEAIVPAVHVALSNATQLRATLFKCKFGGSFEQRACWACGDPPTPYQVAARFNASRRGAVHCSPPVLDGYPPLSRVYSGIQRVELSFDDQQWTQFGIGFDYIVPWRALSVYPSSGPVTGGTYVQVAAKGLHAAATAYPNPEQWRLAFSPADADNNSRLDAQELTTVRSFAYCAHDRSRANAAWVPLGAFSSIVRNNCTYETTRVPLATAGTLAVARTRRTARGAGDCCAATARIRFQCRQRLVI